MHSTFCFTEVQSSSYKTLFLCVAFSSETVSTIVKGETLWSGELEIIVSFSM